MVAIALVLLATFTIALVVERTHELGWVATLELGVLSGRDPLALRAALQKDAPDSVLGRIAAAAGEDEDDREIAIEVAIREQRQRVARGLRPLRVLAASASGLGFAGAIWAIASVHVVDHGLLDLDPARLAREALGEASVVLALGLGTSAFALSSLVALQERARTATKELERFADALLRAGGGGDA